MQAIVKTELMDQIEDELNTILIQASDMSEDKQERVLSLLVSLRMSSLGESCMATPWHSIMVRLDYKDIAVLDDLVRNRQLENPAGPLSRAEVIRELIRSAKRSKAQPGTTARSSENPWRRTPRPCNPCPPWYPRRETRPSRPGFLLPSSGFAAPQRRGTPMLYAMLAACATLIFILVLAVPHAAKAHRLARLFRSQQKWAEMMDRHDSPLER